MNICETRHEDVQAALQMGWYDAEDALIAVSCRNVAADYLITRDKKQVGFQDVGIPALSPETFFELVEHEYGLHYDEVDF